MLKRILQGAWTAEALAFGEAQLRRLAILFGNGHVQQSYQVFDSIVHVKYAPPFNQIIVFGVGGIRYEFFTSEHVDDTISTPGFDGYVGGSALRVGFRATGAQYPKALYSTVFTPGADDTWLLRDTEAVNSTDSGLITWNSWQSQKMQEHVWHRTGSMVTSTQAQPAGLANKCNWNSPYIASPYTTDAAFIADYGRDVLPSLYSSAGVIIAAPILESAWLTWRTAAVQTVSGDNGGDFFICSDNYGRFHIYRAVSALPTGLTADFKTYTPPYPAWVTIPDIAEPLQRINDWLWRFNSDATKCVSVPFHAEPNADFKKYVGPSPASSIFGTILHPEDTGVIDSDYLLTAHDDTPGLVEFGIAITATGPGALEFDVVFTLLRSEYFTDNYRFFFDAAYFLADVEQIGIAADTLMTAEVQCKVPTGGYEAEVVIEFTSTVIELDRVTNMQSHCVINSNDASLTATEQLRFPISTPLYMAYPNGTYVRTYGYPPSLPTPFGATYGGATIPTSGGDVDYFPIGPVGAVVGGSPLREGFLFALELSSFSVVYSSFDYPTQVAYLRGLSFGVEFYKHDYTVALKNTPPLLDPVETVPSARPYQTALNAMLAIEPGQGFCVHPSGHWSCAVVGVLAAGVNVTTGDADLDWISVITGTDEDGIPVRTRYRHKDLFNTAFNQTRDYAYYDTEPFTGKNLVDHGGFRTTGYWVSF